MSRHWLAAVLVTTTLLVCGSVAELPMRSAQAAEVAGLHDTLINGLRISTPGDRKFIAKTVDYVKTDKLTRKMVTEVFQYVRNKVPVNRRPIVFRILLQRRAKRIGVDI